MGGVAALWYGARTAKLFAPWAGTDVKGYEYYTNLVHDPEFLKQFQATLEARLRDEYSLVGTRDKVARGVRPTSTAAPTRASAWCRPGGSRTNGPWRACLCSAPRRCPAF